MADDIRVTPYGSADGLLLTAEPQLAVDELDRSWLLELLAEAGYLVLRGFEPSVEQFSGLVRSVCTRTMLDPAREFSSGKAVQQVDIGTDSIGLHVEHGTNPLAPDLSWFFCSSAARKGSQTTVCDGYRVWDALDSETRDLFRSQDLVYERNLEEQKWRSIASYVLDGAKPDEDITVDDLIELAAAFGDKFEVRPNSDGSIYYVYQVPAVHPTLFGERPAFANSILGPSFHYEKPHIGLADGSELSAEVVSEIEKVSTEFTDDIEWQSGDVAIVDNTRVMHGRRAIEDVAGREIFVALGYVEDATAAA